MENNLAKEVLPVAIEPEIKEVLDDHRKILNEHTEKIEELRIDSEVSKEKLNNISIQLTRIENNNLTSNNALLASNNSVLQTLNLVVGNTTQINTNNADVTKIKSNNRRDILLKFLTLVGVALAGYLGAKYGISITP